MSTNGTDRVFWQDVRRSCEEFEFNFDVNRVVGVFGPSYWDDYAYMLTTRYQQRKLKRPFLQGGELRRYSRVNELTGIVMLDSFLFSPIADSVSLRSVMVAVDPCETEPFAVCTDTNLSTTNPEENSEIRQDFYRSLSAAAFKGSRFLV